MIAKMSIGWNFPGNNNGQINGISEAGIETFKGTLIASLTREICQNSLDAKLPESNKPVCIIFELIDLDSEQIPGYSELKEAIEGCYNFWKELNNEKASRFFEKAITLINKRYIKVLRISDYNTEGLTGSKKAFNSPWQNLVKSNGVSDKGASAGGSFGIGKAAPFACSGVRTIFYRTLDREGIKAAQGIARLVSYCRKINNSENEITTGIGYYGSIEKNTCVDNIGVLNQISSREEIGTDLFILGFEEQEEWQEDMITELLEGFMLAFLRGKLEVKVGEVNLTKDTLGTIIESYKERAKLAYDYYKVMTSKESLIFTESFESMGTINLRVLFEEGLNRKVLISRESGMKLFDKNRISSSIQFSAVLDMEGEELNAFFRKMESPQHNAWEYDRYEENPKKAKKLRVKLYNWIKETIIDAGQYSSGDEVDAEGVGDLLPDFFDYQDNVGSQKEESISDVTKEWTFKIITSPISNQDDMDGCNTVKGEEMTYGDLSEEDGDNSTDKPHGDPNDSSGGEGTPAEAHHGDGNRPFTIAKEVKTHKMRLFVSNRRKKEYTLSFNSKQGIKKGYLEVYIAGEQGNVNVDVHSAYYISKISQMLYCHQKYINIYNLQKDIQHKITFKLQEDEVYSLEVKLYASEI